MTAQRGELYFSASGEVCCARHAPARGSDTWTDQRWRQMTDEEIETFREFGLARCEVCQWQAEQAGGAP